IEEEVLDLHGRPRRPRGREATGDRAADHRDPFGDLPLGRTGEQSEARDGGDRRERFPSKPERPDALDGAVGFELARGVALDRELELVGRNSGPVVGDLYPVESSTEEADRD